MRLTPGRRDRAGCDKAAAAPDPPAVCVRGIVREPGDNSARIFEAAEGAGTRAGRPAPPTRGRLFAATVCPGGKAAGGIVMRRKYLRDNVLIRDLCRIKSF